MKGYKTLVPIALVVCLLLSFYMLINTRITTEKEYNNYLAEARNYAKQGIAVDALENYGKALAIKNTIEINIEVGNFYVEMENVVDSIGWGEKMVESFPHSHEAYDFLLTRYREINDFNKCFALYDTIQKREISSETITKLMNEIKYVYYLGEAYEDVGVYSEGYCAALYEGKWGLVDEIGEKSAPFNFEKVGNYIDGLAPVIDSKKEVYFVDNQGNKKLVPQIEDSKAELSSIVGDSFAVSDGSKWTFYNKDNKKISESYSDISLLANGFVAVESDSRWLLLNDKFEKVNDNAFVDIVQDDRGIVFRNDVYFANIGKGYNMFDASGKQISDKSFIEARLFLDTTYAAVKTDKGWTYVDSKGNYPFKDLFFEDARSFSNGFAAVKKNGQWGFINLEGKTAVDFQFKDAKDFNAHGCVFVEIEDTWQLLRLYSHNYES